MSSKSTKKPPLDKRPPLEKSPLKEEHWESKMVRLLDSQQGDSTGVDLNQTIFVSAFPIEFPDRMGVREQAVLSVETRISNNEVDEEENFPCEMFFLTLEVSSPSETIKASVFLPLYQDLSIHHRWILARILSIYEATSANGLLKTLADFRGVCFLQSLNPVMALVPDSWLEVWNEILTVFIEPVKLSPKLKS